MGEQFIRAKDFNRIKTFEEQVHTVSRHDLEQIGSIYIQNRVDYCCGLLHRHYDLEENHVMVHGAMIREGREDLYRSYHIQALKDHRITNHSLHLNDNLNFVPFEYEIDADDTARPLPDNFLTQLKHLLVERGLQHVIAVVPRPKLHFENNVLVESLLPEIQGAETATFSKHSIFDTSFITTLWSFSNSQSGVEITEVQKCTLLPTGLHTTEKKATMG